MPTAFDVIFYEGNREVILRGILSDYWARRWNTAFRDLTHRFLFRPLLPRCGAGGALFTVFALSGLVHDLAITLPAGGGYGGPTCFFLLQAGGLVFERSKLGRAWQLGRGWQGWLFTASFLLLPAELLLPSVFVGEVILPMMHALGGL